MTIPELHEVETTDFVDEMTAEECFNYFRDNTQLTYFEDKIAGEYLKIHRLYKIELEDGSCIYEKMFLMGEKVPKHFSDEPTRIWRSLLKQYLQHHINNGTLPRRG